MIQRTHTLCGRTTDEHVLNIYGRDIDMLAAREILVGLHRLDPVADSISPYACTAVGDWKLCSGKHCDISKLSARIILFSLDHLLDEEQGGSLASRLEC